MKTLLWLLLGAAGAVGGCYYVVTADFHNPYTCYECGCWLDDSPHPVTTLHGDTLGYCCDKCIVLYRDASNTPR